MVNSNISNIFYVLMSAFQNNEVFLIFMYTYIYIYISP